MRSDSIDSTIDFQILWPQIVPGQHASHIMDTHYDTIGVNYAHTRRPDPRIAKQILSALGNCQSVVNVGTGSYEPADRMVVAVEPSTAMIGQRTRSMGSMGSDSIDFMSSLECTRFPAFLFESITLTVLNQSSLTPLIQTPLIHRLAEYADKMSTIRLRCESEKKSEVS